MKQFLLLVVGVCVAGLASAINTSWRWNSNGSGWQAPELSSVYFVYSTEAIATGAEVVAATGTNYGSAAGAAGDTPGTSWTSPSTPAGATAVGGLSVSPYSGNWNNVGMNDVSLGSGTYYFYLVVFNNATASNATAYAVAQAGTTGQVVVNDKGQVFVPTESGPAALEFLDPTWIAYSHIGPAPEPTALALLALGLAGAALRRRVR